MEKQLRILLLAANSGTSPPPLIEREFREIENRLLSSVHREQFIVKTRLGVRTSDLQQLLLLYRPHVLHFSGRGDKRTGILLANDSESPRPVPNQALTQMLQLLKDDLRVLVFNACYTKRRALGLSRTFDYTIGMNDTLDDASAIDFSESFYQALGHGRTVKVAFELACNRLHLEGRATSKQPFLLCRKELDTSIPLLSPAVATPLSEVSSSPEAASQIRDAAASRQAEAAEDPAALETLLLIPKRKWDPDYHPPAALLRADFRVVPFFGRVVELATVNAWINDRAPLGIMLITGRGGSGKTRLAVEISLIAQQQNYHAGFLTWSPVTLATWHSFPSFAKPVLVVIDYAEEYREHLPKLITAMLAAARNGETSYRLLLLARGVGDWWSELKTAPGEVGELLQHKTSTKRLQLGGIAANEEEARTTYRQAIEAFSEKLGAVGSSAPVPDLSREALLTHTQALLAVLGEVQCSNQESEVFEFLLNRERRFWRRQLVVRDIDPAFLPVFEKLVAVVTLRRGAAEVDVLDRLMKLVRTTHGLDGVMAMKLRSVLTNTYGNGSAIEPLQPDPLGEHLLAHHMTREIEDLASL